MTTGTVESTEIDTQELMENDKERLLFLVRRLRSIASACECAVGEALKGVDCCLLCGKKTEHAYEGLCDYCEQI